MMTGAAGCAVWGGLLLLRWTLKGQRRRPSLRWMPWALAACMIAATVRVVMAVQTYPWFYD
jgi:hypothetical protein